MISIAGSGCVSAAGYGCEQSWSNYRAGKKNWSIDAATGLPVHAVKQLPHHQEIQNFADNRSLDRSSLLAIHAARQAVGEAGWMGSDFAILVGCSRGPTDSWESGFATFTQTGTPPVKTSPNTTLGSIGFALADFFGTNALADGMSVTCSSGFHALIHGVALLQSGMVDRVLVGGTEAPLTPFTLQQMKALRVYAEVERTEDFPCRPLATPSSGMVVGEGAGFLALERGHGCEGTSILGLGFARERNNSSTGISAEGEAIESAMRKAIATTVPDLIIAHAPGTKRGDAAELAAISKVFGQVQPPVTSVKFATGHTFGASGPLAAVAGISMIEYGAVFPPYLPQTSPHQPKTVLINATGFGGNAVSVLIGRET